METQKEALKGGRLDAALRALAGHGERPEVDDEHGRVRTRHRYLKRSHQPPELSPGLGRKTADRLGEIESAHRYVAQQRLKRPSDRPYPPAELSVLGQIIIADRPPGGAFEIVKLAVAQRPQEGGKSEAAERQREGREVHDDIHREPCARCALSAFKVTKIEELDIAKAAMSGVTPPSTASGTAIRL